MAWVEGSVDFAAFQAYAGLVHDSVSLCMDNYEQKVAANNK